MMRGFRDTSRLSAARRWTFSFGVAAASLAPMSIVSIAIASAALMALGRRSMAVRWLMVAVGIHVLRSALIRRASNPGRKGAAGRTGAAGYHDTPDTCLITANLWNGTDDLGAIADELTLIGADIVLLQEVTPIHLARLERLGALAQYRSRAVVPDRGHAGLGVWSRFDLSEVEWLNVAGELQLRAWVSLPQGRFRLYAVHAPAPVPSKIDHWCSWFDVMSRELEDEMSGHAEPVVVAGDFNATVDHRGFRRLLASGVADAAWLARRGWQMTWPTRWRTVPPLFRIDHVLLRSNVRLSSYRVGRGHGSDHRPVVVNLRLTV